MQKIRQDKCIGNNIRILRTAANYTQEQVVTHLQLQGLDISRWLVIPCLKNEFVVKLLSFRISVVRIHSLTFLKYKRLYPK